MTATRSHVGAASLGSLARSQRSLLDPARHYPLWPPLLHGDPDAPDGPVQYPVEVYYDVAAVPPSLFERGSEPGLGRWQPLLPPLAPIADLGTGATPLLATARLAEFAGFDGDVLVKDESQNPTWSHKDRLNAVAVSAAVRTRAAGVVAASSGNHGASAAAHAARAGLPCVIFTSAETPAPMPAFMAAYGAAVLAVPRAARWALVNEVVERLGFHPVSNLTASHTGHPYGPEGYKTIAYELHDQLAGRSPGAVLVPTGYGELLFGVWKGFLELRELGLIDTVPRMIACEPQARGPLGAALRARQDAAEVPARPTRAHSIGTTSGGYRGVLAVTRSDGVAVAVADTELEAAQRAMAHAGLWQELSGAAGLAGLRSLVASGHVLESPVVCIATSSGFKDLDASTRSAAEISPDWPSVHAALAAQGVA